MRRAIGLRTGKVDADAWWEKQSDDFQVTALSDRGYLLLKKGEGVCKFILDKNFEVVEIKTLNSFKSKDRPDKVLMLANVIKYSETKKEPTAATEG